MKKPIYLLLISILISSCGGKVEKVEEVVDDFKAMYYDLTDVVIPRAETEIISAFESSLSKFENQSEFWREDLKEIQEKLTTDLKDIIGYDVNMLVKSSVAELDKRFKCNVDFFRDRISLKLKSVIEYLKTHPDKRDQTMLYRSLKICSTFPTHLQYEKIIGNETKVLTITGYDMNIYKQDVSLHIKNDEGIIRIVDVKDYLGNPDPYTITINVSGSGIPVEKNDVLLIFKSSMHSNWPITITKNHEPVCKVEEFDFTPDPIQYFPKEFTNDNDFGNQPVAIEGNYSVVVNPTNIDLRFNFIASEQDISPQHQTVVKEYTSHRIWDAPKNTIIVEDNLFKRNMDIKFVDYDKVQNEREMGEGAIRKVTFDISRDGPDIGAEANVKFEFGPFKIKVKQIENCKN